MGLYLSFDGASTPEYCNTCSGSRAPRTWIAEARHDSPPDRRRDRATFAVGYDRFRLIEADPDRSDDLRCVAHEPEIG